jgi:hypothetical protein
MVLCCRTHTSACLLIVARHVVGFWDARKHCVATSSHITKLIHLLRNENHDGVCVLVQANYVM